MQQHDTQELRQQDSRHHLHPFTDTKELGDNSRIITRAEGIYIYDSEGNRILDAMAGLWCVNLGYGRQELVDAAQQQMQELPYYNNFFKTAHPPAIKLAKKLTELAPEHINHVFFTGSGSESNDTVVRMVRRYWQLKGQPEKTVIIGRRNGYHGSTVAGASLGGMAPMHEQGGPMLPDIEHIAQPYWFGEGREMDPQEFGLLAARSLEQKIKTLGVERVAAFIAEPVQGAGGVIIPPESYWPEIQRICDHYGILLIADEVICGFGRVGQWFGSQHFNIKPDLMPIAKGLSSGYLPIGGVLVGDRVADLLIEQGGEFYHGFTYSGHPACAAVALRNLELLEQEGVIDRVRDVTGPYFARQWATLASHPLVGEARSLGLLGALELVADKGTMARFAPGIGSQCRDNCFQSGIVMRSVGETMVVSPPLVITEAEIDQLVTLARRSLDLTARQLGIMD
ncbi:aspartate aminotransferase family protein [Oceanisphaera psychrotolerans]|uniref:Aminotransferase n=1 Tax=Oceanisphaera psychrotolerans TaxID=1414654 RepID=A0A1J4QET0_9GAMM|nr:aspartate aminotransferase family protein [Oceanisphaera psychrotolerans]OIN11010.1 aminotransferase [Oceanisphaera psychrotolerans]